jgi:signal transduction histidine kinase
MLGTDDGGRSVPLRATLDGQVGEIRASYENAAITVDGEIPTVSVLADELLGSVFRNVLKNAVQHNDKPVPEVVVRAEVGADAVSVRVADNGPGIPEERLETVFGRGRKGLDSEGTGIGLYLVRTVVERYGGSVGVENREPEGAVFTIELPRADTDR